MAVPAAVEGEGVVGELRLRPDIFTSVLQKWVTFYNITLKCAQKLVSVHCHLHLETNQEDEADDRDDLALL